MGHQSVYVKKSVLKDDLKYNGITLLHYEIEYPEFRSFRFNGCMPKINCFYRKRAIRFQRYCKEVLFPMAVEQYQYDVANGYPIRPYEAVETFHVTYNRDCIVSLYYDQYQFTGGAHGNTFRYAQTWDLSNCRLLSFNKLVFCPPDYKTFVLDEVEAQIKIEPELYFEDYPTLIRETFNDNNFYCTEKGIIFFYQQYDIAPYASGIREFLIPYGNCVMNPQAYCSVSAQ